MSVTFGMTGCKPKETKSPAAPVAEVQPSITASGQGGEPPLFLAYDKEKENVKVPFKPVDYKVSIPAYQVNADLSNVVNLEQYGTFTEAQKQMLAKNGFMVTPSNEEQLFYIYERNEYLKVPSFVTVDSVLQVYHVFYDYSLRKLEADKLANELVALTDSMLRKSVDLYNRLQNERLKALQIKNIAYFGVAELALGGNLPLDIPEEAGKLANKEYEKVKGQGNYQRSDIFPFDLDYSQYKPRGHYTRSEELKRFFKAMMWYGQAPFPLYQKGDVRNEEQTLQALLITYTMLLEDGNDLTRWSNIYEPTSFYVGRTDDLNIFMGQRYIADSEILQDLVTPIKRPVPKGLDIMGVLGSKRAEDLLMNVYEEYKTWDGYKPNFERLKDKFSKPENSRWQSNMYFGWLWILKGLLREYGEGYPEFMQTQAWQDKSLNTALGSWSELRHDTILYGKGTAAECGGDEQEPPRLKSYVEPNIEAYERLLWLTTYSKENLKSRSILERDMESKMVRFEELLQFLIKCSVKELNNEVLTEDEGLQLLYYGGWLENLTDSFMEYGRLRQLESETDRHMALIADVHTVAGGGCLEVGVGPAYQIYVVVPVGGKLYLTRGAVFSYYEFMSENRLTDEE
ncbi:MAG: DUF3160 domain-containing protein [Caulobacteraceae bacterium]